MKTNVILDNAAGPGPEVYLAAARDVWHAGEATGPLRLTVTSNSMRPLLCVGDRVVVQPIDPRILRPGDVLVVQRGGEWITHRLVGVDERGWHTHGDNTRYWDEPVSAAEIVGRVITIERGTQTIDLQDSRWRVIDRRINRVQRVQLRVIGGTRSSRIKRGLAVLINWPFQLAMRWLIRF